jgi:hypothetical protein
VPASLDGRLVDTVVQADERKTFAGLDDGSFLIRDGIPGVIFTDLIHILGSLAAENDGPERCLGQGRILGRADPGGIPATVIIAKESVFGGYIKGATDYMPAALTGQEGITIKTVGGATEGAEI